MYHDGNAHSAVNQTTAHSTSFRYATHANYSTCSG